MIEKFSRDYRCLRCGAQMSSEELKICGEVPRCFVCGYRVLKRDKPLSIEEVKASYIDPFNEFIDNGLQEFISNIGVIEVKRREAPFKIKLGQVWFIESQTRISGPYVTEADGTIHEIYPMEAKLRNLTYATPVSLEMALILNNKEIETELIYIGDFPIMVKSKLCYLSRLSAEELKKVGENPNDPGGYFIIEGVKRDVLPEHFAEMFKVSFLKLLWETKRRMELSKKHLTNLSSYVHPRIGNYIVALMKMLGPVQVVRKKLYDEIVYEPLTWYSPTLVLTQSFAYYAQQLGRGELCNVPYRVMKFF